ncbi:hypothetical protein V6N11_073538 [Hibiscus sabdariffa]|uniref:Cytochrome P450 CYP749A22-like n=1 Tax=Hibiscus sabdariffa TaxID=183260 RepID=A0ABR2NTQ5_9ROSI
MRKKEGSRFLANHKQVKGPYDTRWLKFSVAGLVSSDISACGGVLIANGGVFRALFFGPVAHSSLAMATLRVVLVALSIFLEAGFAKNFGLEVEIGSVQVINWLSNPLQRPWEEKVVTGAADGFGSDFLGLLVNAYHEPNEKNRLSVQDLVDECKTFYFARYETTNSSLVWTFLLLATHTDWQDKARTEVMEVFGNRNQDSERFARLKTITMIINETLRLYPRTNGAVREVARQVQLGKLTLPTPLELDIRTVALHHDPDLWGDDVHLFKRERFVEGVSKATNYNAAAFLPFGWGPRSCVGMSFTITETKIALSMILQRYSFTLSPAYVHAPVLRFTLKSQHGLQLLFHSLQGDA